MTIASKQRSTKKKSNTLSLIHVSSTQDHKLFGEIIGGIKARGGAGDGCGVLSERGGQCRDSAKLKEEAKGRS